MSDKTVTIVTNTNTAVINQTALEVVTVGTQGPAGPNSLGGKGLQSGTAADGDMLRYNASTEQWEFTQEIDAGTY